MKLVNWIMCCKDDDAEMPDIKDLGKNATSMELPGYLNRFDGTSKGAWSGSDEDISTNDSIKKFKRRGANSIASDNHQSECDSGLGSASDSGRGKSSTKSEGSSEGSASETEKCPEEIENIKRLKSLVRKSEPITVAPTVTTVDVQLEQPKEEITEPKPAADEKPKKAYVPSKTGGRRKPKRNESTLSRFSSIFNNGRNLTEVLVEEFRLNDRFSGLSMDRIWGGFMDEIKEEGEDGKVPEPETPETKARRALNEKTKKRRRRRARNQMAPSAVKTTRAIQPKSFKRQKSRKHWQQELPQDW